MVSLARNPRLLKGLLVVLVVGGAAFMLSSRGQQRPKVCFNRGDAEDSKSTGPSRAARKSPGPPKFTREPGKGESFKDLNPDIGPGGLRPIDAWNSESRDEAWAPGVETAVQNKMQKDLSRISPDVSVSVNCKTTMCKVSWNGPGELDAGVGFALLTLYRGRGSGPVGPREALFVYRGSFNMGPSGSSFVNDADSLIDVLDQRRNTWLKNIVADKEPSVLRWLPKDVWARLAE